MLMGYNMSLIKIDIYIETNTKIEYKKYTIYKATLYSKIILSAYISSNLSDNPSLLFSFFSHLTTCILFTFP